jgi:diguanylate cyclase (GGDEF)-like protein/PAS domain S-box-containing protein
MNKRDEIYTSMLEQKVAERVRDLMIFSAIFDNSNEGMILTDDQEVIIKVNKAFTTITGYTMQEVVGLTPRVLQSGVQDIAFYQQMWHDIGEKGIWTGNIINKNSQGKHCSEYLTILKLYNEQTDTINYVSIFSDLSKLHETLDRFQKVIDLQSHLIIVTDGEQILFGNKQLYEFFGFNSLQVFLENHDCVCHSFIEDENYFSLAKVPKDMHWIDVISSLDEKDRVVLIYDKQSGTNRSFQISITHYDSNSYLIVFMDVSRNILENRKLQIKAQTDRLTGCYNREYLYSYFEDFTQKTFEHSRSVGIILYDIDKFKKINDTYGHNRGDYVLVHLCHLIQSKMRADDLLVRWGGEEFLIFLMTNSIEETTHIAQKLRAYVEKEEFEEIEHLTCSFGITLYNAGEKLETAIQRADEALYEAKAAGRNQVKVS